VTVNQEISEYLMYELAASRSDFKDDSSFSYSAITNIAILDSIISESLVKMYLAPIKDIIPEDLIIGTLSYFHGAELLVVSCDCSPEDTKCLVSDIESTSWHLFGRGEKIAKSEFYDRAALDILELRESLFADG